jgi:hypothetical protein
LFDLIEAPFKEIAIAKDTTDAAALAARSALQKILDLHPAGTVDPGRVQPEKPWE